MIMYRADRQLRICAFRLPDFRVTSPCLVLPLSGHGWFSLTRSVALDAVDQCTRGLLCDESRERHVPTVAPLRILGRRVSMGERNRSCAARIAESVGGSRLATQGCQTSGLSLLRDAFNLARPAFRRAVGGVSLAPKAAGGERLKSTLSVMNSLGSAT